MNHKVHILTLLKGKTIATEDCVLATKREAETYIGRVREFYATAIKAKRLEVVYVGETDLPIGVMQGQAKVVDAARAKRIADNKDERVCAEGHVHATPEHAIACPNAPAPDVTRAPTRAKAPAPRVERTPSLSSPRKGQLRPSGDGSMGGTS